MRLAPLIGRKRDGGALTPAEWEAIIVAYVAGAIPDYQMSALLMAITWRGMEPQELAALTRAMLDSGVQLDFGDGTVPRVDKHSTGGVGDKVSLALAPIVAACGVAVPMMSGRGLGHTGGTTDKLESIPGLRTDLSPRQAFDQVRRIGLAMFGQTADIAPADRRLYALRDVTGTVPSIPLIAASIMSKKLAEGLTGLVLDVKHGAGAFLPGEDRAIELAETMVMLGEANGCRTTALLTAMDRPLGRAIGNSLEVEEALVALEGEGPEDLQAVTRSLAVEMLLLAGVADSPGNAGRMVQQAIASGKARQKFAEMIEAQGGNPAIVDDPGGLPQANAVEIYESPEGGTITRIDPLALGQAVVAMGGGRTRLDDPIDHSVGFVVSVSPGQVVERGEPIASVFARDAAGIELGMAALDAAVRFEVGALPLPLITHRITARGIEVL
jgi:pyrimidine-nucleoside phosphorylase